MSLNLLPDKTLCLIFSKDRPLQLDATLRSLYVFCMDIENLDIHILYKSDELEIVDSYKELKIFFNGCLFIQEDFFQKQVHTLLNNYKWVLFLVDDNIFFNNFSITQILNFLLSHDKAIGFSLRLGKNITRSYLTNQKISPPVFNDLSIYDDAPERTIFGFEWPGSQGYFNYPLEVSSSLYKTTDILRALKGVSYRNPNELESKLAQNADVFTDRKPILLCHERSSACCLPVNKVQNLFDNRSGTLADYSAQSLFKRWKQSSQLCIEAYSLMNPTACHEELPLAFEKRLAHSRLKSTNNPLVSIIVPTFNRGHLIEATLQSILQQTFSDFELIILDDGSTDTTEEMVTPYLADSRLRYRKIEHLGNLAMVRNIGIHMARGIYCAFCDSDDTWYPDKLKTQVRHLADHPHLKMISSSCDVFGDIEDVWPPHIPHCSYENLAINNFLICSMTVVDMDILRKVGGFAVFSQVRLAQDWDLWLRIARDHAFDIHPHPLGKYLFHSEGISRNAIRMHYDELFILQRTIASDSHLERLLGRVVRHKGKELTFLLLRNRRLKDGLLAYFATRNPRNLKFLNPNV